MELDNQRTRFFDWLLVVLECNKSANNFKRALSLKKIRNECWKLEKDAALWIYCIMISDKFKDNLERDLPMFPDRILCGV